MSFLSASDPTNRVKVLLSIETAIRGTFKGQDVQGQRREVDMSLIIRQMF